MLVYVRNGDGITFWAFVSVFGAISASQVIAAIIAVVKIRQQQVVDRNAIETVAQASKQGQEDIRRDLSEFKTSVSSDIGKMRDDVTKVMVSIGELKGMLTFHAGRSSHDGN